MKILFVCDMAPWRLVANGEMPSHFLFGVAELIETWKEDFSRGYIKECYGGGYVDFVHLKRLRLSSAYKVLKIAKGYDIVYDANIHVVSFFLGILNKLHLFPAKLVTLFHYPPYWIYMKLCRSDVSMFLSHELYDSARKYVHDNRIMFANSWYPDTEWYKKYHLSNDENKQFDFFDSGKTFRCHTVLVDAVKELPQCSALLVIDKLNIPENYSSEMNNFHIHELNYSSMTECGKLMGKCKSMVIPVKKGKRSIICGSTCFMDAVAMGMPVVWHKGCPSSDDIIKYKLGVLYKREDVNDLKRALTAVSENYDFYHKNMIEFSKSHNIYKFSAKLIKGFQQILGRLKEEQVK